jgi:arylsulfatase A-like enzyme
VLASAHLDENISLIMRAVEELDLLATTRIIYTSDHGELFGAHGLFGKCNLYEGAAAVPLVISGPDIPGNGVVSQLVSHVDLFPTIIEGAGARLTEADAGLLGQSLFDAIRRQDTSRIAFAEYHGHGSKAGQFMVAAAAVRSRRVKNWSEVQFALLREKFPVLQKNSLFRCVGNFAASS